MSNLQAPPGGSAGSLHQRVAAIIFTLAALIKRIGPCPSEGNGVHRWVFSAAGALRKCSEEMACAVIAKAVANCGRLVPEREIRSAVLNARQPGSKCAAQRWPSKNPELILEAEKNGVGVEALQRLSPRQPDSLRTQEIIDWLYPGPPDSLLICVGRTERRALTRPKGEVRSKLECFQFIVPSRMIAPRGRTQDGKWSQRCLANTGPRRFLVVESDPTKWEKLSADEQASFGNKEKYITAKKDQAAAVIWHLAEKAKYLRLVMVVDSGGKSLHGWFLVEGVAEEYVLKFFRYAVALGADPATWTRCQWVRMPGGTRDNGKRQVVLYFNPKPLEVA